MNITIKGKEQELKFTFNSFKYMENFNLEDIKNLETTPFKVIPLMTTLTLGAVNHNPKVFYSRGDVEEFLAEYVETNSPFDYIKDLMELMEESNFFKNLQKKETPEK